MIGLAVGLVCGVAEFYLLTRLAYSLTSKSPYAVLILMGKFFLLAGTLVAGAFLIRDQLVQMGIGIAAPLLIGAVAVFIRNTIRTPKKTETTEQISKADDLSSSDKNSPNRIK